MLDGRLTEVTLQWEISRWDSQKLAAAACQRWPLNRGDTTMVELLLELPKAGRGYLSEVAA